MSRLDFGRFIYRDLYLMVPDENGTFLAHGNNPSRVGTGRDVREPRGKAFTREMVRVGRERGDGWVGYAWQHPVTGEIWTKNGDVRRKGGVTLYCSVQATR